MTYRQSKASDSPSKAYLSRLLGSYRRIGQAAGLSHVTLNGREKRLQNWLDWLEREKRLKMLDQLTSDDVTAYLAHELRRGQAASTVRTAYQTLHAFCHWLETEGHINRSPMVTLHSPKVPKKRTPMLAPDEVRALLHACEGNSFTARRDMALIRMLIDSGLRCSELIALRVEDIDEKRHTISVRRGKGGDARVTAYGVKTAVALDRYLLARENHRKASSPFLWLSQRGGISGPTVRRILRYRGLKAGLKMWPHRLRHQWAHLWLSSGGSERSAMALAGWSSSAMLGIYGEAAAVDRALDEHQRHSPGDKF